MLRHKMRGLPALSQGLEPEEQHQTLSTALEVGVQVGMTAKRRMEFSLKQMIMISASVATYRWLCT